MTSWYNKVIINGVPEYCSLAEIQTKLGATFRRNENPVTAVKRCKDEHGRNIAGKFEIELEDNAGTHKIKKIKLVVILQNFFS